MLRITVKEKGSEQRWTLQGRLTKECVAELVSNWQAARSRTSAGNRIVDLNEITVIDKSGEEVLSMMIGEGATRANIRFSASRLIPFCSTLWQHQFLLCSPTRLLTFSWLETRKAPD
jgi:ABC-type transporter Mla MlaB component